MDRLGRSYTFPSTQVRQTKAPKSRLQGVTEIRGPYYSVMGPTYLEDILEAQGQFIDGLKFAGGSLSLMPRERIKLITALAHRHGIYVNTGGWADQMLAKGPRFFDRYVTECKDLGFDVVELSNEFLKFREDDLMRLIRTVRNAGLKAKPEILFEVGRGTTNEHSDREEYDDLELLMKRAERCLEAGAYMILIESDGLTRNVPAWRTDVLAEIVGRLGLERTMFEAHEPNVFEWFIKNYGSKVNLYVNHSDSGHLERLRSGAPQGDWIQSSFSI
ncbi:unnamed protein product [Calypogeia fissa]